MTERGVRFSEPVVDFERTLGRRVRQQRLGRRAIVGLEMTEMAVRELGIARIGGDGPLEVSGAPSVADASARGALGVR